DNRKIFLNGSGLLAVEGFLVAAWPTPGASLCSRAHALADFFLTWMRRVGIVTASLHDTSVSKCSWPRAPTRGQDNAQTSNSRPKTRLRGRSRGRVDRAGRRV